MYKVIYLNTIFTIIFILNLSAQEISMPATPMQQAKDTYFDTTIIDNYRNLEDINSEDTKTWIKKQNDYSRSYLDKYRRNENVLPQIEEINNYYYSLPRKHDKYYYHHTKDKVFLYESYNQISRDRRVVADLDKVTTTDKLSIQDFEVSKNGNYIAIQCNKNGSDWQEILISKLGSGGKFLKEKLVDVKFSGIEWKDDGFFYSKYLKRDQFSGDTLPMIYYHKCGTEQSQDVLIDKTSGPIPSIYYNITSDGRYLFVYKVYKRYNKKHVYYIDLTSPTWELKPFIEKLNFDFQILDSHADYLIAYTKKLHVNGSLVKIYPNEPFKWIPLTAPYSDAIIEDAKVFENQIICNVRKGATNFFSIYEHSGKHIVNVTMKDGYTIGGFDGGKNDDELFFHIQTYFFPPVVYKLDLKTYKYKPHDVPTETTYDVKEYTIEIKEYVSKDNVKIPITLVYKNGLKLDGSNPTLLKSYGGFGATHSPHFDPALVYFLSQGGVFAYAHVRGEGTFGLNWANEGKRLKKQNTINDFIAAAEYLIKEKYTSANHLAITGGSHGGFLVGAAMVQRPDLFKIVIPVVGPFDILRKEKFTVGVSNFIEYGTVKDPQDFKNMLSYSPYHNIKAGVNYPTTLVMTSDNDERVPPFHSYKFVAQLQNNPGQKNPIFLRVEKQAGHNGGGTIEEDADFFGLLLNVLK